MTVRGKLTIQFTTIVASILLLIFLLIYILSSSYRKSEFNSRLEEKALSTARLLLEVEEVDSTLLSSIEQNRLGQLISERIVILDLKGKILYSTDPQNTLSINKDRIGTLEEKRMIEYQVGETEVVGLLFPVGTKRFPVFAGGIDKYGIRKVDNLRNTMIFVWIISILIVAFAGWIFSGRALKPVAEMIREVDAIQFGKFQERIGEGNGKDELAMLAKTFNKLLERIEKAIATEKMFVANASHEIRNPLTVIISQLEVVLLKERDTEEYRKTIQSVLDDIKDLNDVSNRLLVLAQVSQPQPANSLIKSSVEQLLLDSVDDYLKNNPFATIELNIDESAHLTQLYANQPLIKKAFINLIENGCKFGDNKIIIDLRIKNDKINLSFKDEGIGIQPEDLPHIFDPFYRGKNSQFIRGHGIGLSLVKRIIELHKGLIEIRTEENKGTTITLLFESIKSGFN
jgi:signal transduction histidine kinase